VYGSESTAGQYVWQVHLQQAGAVETEKRYGEQTQSLNRKISFYEHSHLEAGICTSVAIFLEFKSIAFVEIKAN
jgi:hypothetical protein